MAYAQSTKDILKEQAGEGVKEGARTVTVAAGEKATDKILGKIFDHKKKKNKDNSSPNNNAATGTNNTASGSDESQKNTSSKNGSDDTGDLTAYSKFDFVPGSKIIAFEDFSQDAIGDFPDKWNTNSTGEVVTLNKETAHWLCLKKQGRFIPEFITSLPDNFTLQFDLQCNSQLNDYSPYLRVWMMSGGQTKDEFSGWFINDGKRSGTAISIEPTNSWNHSGRGRIYTYEDGSIVINGDNNEIGFFNKLDKNKAKVSIWRQKQRIRVYMDNEKIFDLPRAFAAGKNYDFLMFDLPTDVKNQDAYYISNITLAIGAPDTRNKLINEGKFSTTGILFDVNSANIKPESYGTLKEIADVLKENSTVHVSIIGHTDSDGNADYNLKLSKERAQAVKDALSSEFGIDVSRMTTDGKGAAQPVADNKTPEGKAQNRRVEFVKQ
jgi:outer membrane protein OmpA-like peptidoglycan-associated protein